MLPEQLKISIEEELSTTENKKVNIRGFRAASGGCINNGGIIDTSSGEFFIKWNNKMRFPGMFEAEKRGLKLLYDAHAIRIPEVIVNGESGDLIYIVMENIQVNARKPDYWTTLGIKLAKLHSNKAEKFGIDHDNFIGSLAQSNRTHSDWVEFFITERLARQIEVALNNGAISSTTVKQFDLLYTRFDNFFPKESPVLIHGDLWSGNLITDDLGEPCLIDPAVYYGHREIELSMTKLFGGFDEDFYRSYNEFMPLESGFEERVAVYNLYPLMVHVNLFGGHYLQEVEFILKRY